MFRIMIVAALVSCNSTAVDKSAKAGTLTIFAAASLTDVFEAVSQGFKSKHPEVKVQLSFGGSQSLRTQIEHGAPAHLFASANPKHLAILEKKGIVRTPIVFAGNSMVVVTPPDNPAKIASFKDLPNASRIVLSGPSVPAGMYAEQILKNANYALGRDFIDRVKKNVVSQETHVRQTLQKVVMGEADAALVYSTDALSAGKKVNIFSIPADYNVQASYPIAVVKGGAETMAKMFTDYLVSDEGMKILESHGFSRLKK